jgi:hypothetical protein
MSPFARLMPVFERSAVSISAISKEQGQDQELSNAKTQRREEGQDQGIQRNP